MAMPTRDGGTYRVLMANSHRIAWIDAQIRGGGYPNASRVAARFEISRRQAARDIEYLRYSMGAPIAYSAEHNGYRYTDGAFALPSFVVSDRERSDLMFLAERYGSMAGDAADRVASVLRRLAGHALVDNVETSLPVIDSAEIDTVAVLRRAIEQRRTVAIRYRGTDGVVVTRTLWPYGLSTRFGSLVCVGYCEELGHTHILPLFRFERVEQTGTTFDLPPHVHVHDASRDSVIPKPFVGVVRLDDPADAERLETAVAIEDDTIRLEFHDAQSVISALLSCPSPIEVLSPTWLRQRLIARLDALVARHSVTP